VASWVERIHRLGREHGAELTLAAIVALAAIVRFATLGDQSLDHDETVTAARVLHPSFLQSMQVVVNGERSPPLYYALIWVWSRVWGTGAVGLRSLSAILGTLTVIAAYLAGRELASRRAGLIAAALVALNPYLIWYSQEARSYAALVAFGAFGFYFFARSLRRPTGRALAGWAAMSALALCSHYFAVFPIIGEGAILFASRARRRRALPAITAVAAVGIALVPLAVSQESGGRGNGFRQIPVAQRAETALVKYVGTEGPAPQAGILSTTPGQRQAAAVGVALFAVAIALVAARGSPRERLGALRVGAVAATAFGLPLALAWGGFDFVDPRNVIGALVPALVLAGIGFGTVRASRAGTLAFAGSLALFVVVLRFVDTNPATERHDWRAVAAVIPHAPKPTLFVVPHDARTPLEYYTGRNLDRFKPGRFPDGVATRHVVVLSDYPAITGPGPGFHLVHTRTAPQHWTVKIYAARRPAALDPTQVAGTKVMAQRSTALVAQPRSLLRAEAAIDPGHA
jgi:predicted membrane-bound mannosyltransferase